MLHWSKCIFEKCCFLPAATNRGSADRIWLWNYTPKPLVPCVWRQSRARGCAKSKGTQVIPTPQHEAKPWPFKKSTSFYSKAEQGLISPSYKMQPPPRWNAADAGWLTATPPCSLDCKRPFFHAPEPRFSPNHNALLKPCSLPPCAYIQINLHDSKDEKRGTAQIFTAAWRLPWGPRCHKAPIFLSKWQFI